MSFGGHQAFFSPALIQNLPPRGPMASATQSTRRLWLYWNTLKYLRWQQILGRMWFRLGRPSGRYRRAADRVIAAKTASPSGWHSCARAASMLEPDTFQFLNETGTLASPSDWQSGPSKLWLYNLHYFDDLVAEAAHARRQWHQRLIQNWIDANPAAAGVGWEPYPCSLRIVNWIKADWDRQLLSSTAKQSLAVQVAWLRRRLEYHLLGNHLWANAKALVFAGCYFDGPEAHNWLRKGLGLITRELDEQVLADFGHFERSPMYHAIFAEDLCDLIQLSTVRKNKIPAQTSALWRTKFACMLRWLAVMTHPDGDISFFNDAALGIAPNLKALHDYADSLAVDRPAVELSALEALPESGYVRLSSGPATVLIDVAAVGPDYIPGHAHADTLSFEMSLAGQRLLVNAGTSTYASSQQRAIERGTAQHNTVQVDNCDSSEVWAAFRVARRARVHNARWSQAGDRLEVRAEHDGYQRLPGKVTHARAWSLEPHALKIVDDLSGEPKCGVARFRLAPGWTAHELADHGCDICHADGLRLRMTIDPPNRLRLMATTWSPRFGQIVPISELAIDMVSNRLTTCLSWN
jgi:uncharacterized heparinase superfamily protein